MDLTRTDPIALDLKAELLAISFRTTRFLADALEDHRSRGRYVYSDAQFDQHGRCTWYIAGEQSFVAGRCYRRGISGDHVARRWIRTL